MPRRKPLTIEDLWQIERPAGPSLSPDGAQVVCSLASFDLEANTRRSTLWLLSTLGGAPRPLTQAGEHDGEPRFSPDGQQIGFIARRTHQGALDDTPQFYLIPADGGEARRVGQVPSGIEAFKWCPDGRHIVFIAWVWSAHTGAKAQAKAEKAWRARKTTGLATGQSLHRHWDHVVAEGRVPHLLRMNVDTGKVSDLFEGTDLELTRTDPGADDFDISPDGRRVAFSFDPAHDKRIDGHHAIGEIGLQGGAKARRFRMAAQLTGWSLHAPRYSPDGQRLAFIASHQALKHTAPDQLAVAEVGEPFDVVSAEWDHAVEAPLHWTSDGQAVLLGAEDRGRRHLWRFDLGLRRAERLAEGGWVSACAAAAGVLVHLKDAADHPPQVWAQLPGQAPRRIDRFNDRLMARVAMGHHEEIQVTGAQGDAVQVWLHHPPGFDTAKPPEGGWPLLHVIHGGPHTAMGDAWHFRWCAPLFAAQGYVVALVNYHGSSGFGNAFLDSISHRWGELELQDIEAATDALLARLPINPKRVYASGGSYGGYMVAWMNGHLPAGRYAAHVCHAGCWDWVGMFADDAWSWHAKELGAWYWERPEQVQRQSPVSFAAQLATPTLVVHGALDYRVPDAQGLAYYNTLKARGVPARLLWFPDENHWVLKPANSRQWYQEFFAWLAAHPAAPGPARPKRPRRKTGQAGT